MVNFDEALPYLLMKTTLIIELFSFLSGHMIDNRNIPSLHEGLFKRCTFPKLGDPSSYNCLWWSLDTFSADRTSLQIVTLLAFSSLFILGFSLIYGVLSFYFKELRTRNYNGGMSFINVVNVIVLLLTILIYTFFYASDTKLIRSTGSLVFSWSYYLLYAALGTNILTAIFFLYNPLREQK